MGWVMIKRLGLASLVLVLTGCTTPYTSDGLLGGYSEVQLSENVWRVSFQGNGFTSRERAVDMALLRSADLTIQQGYNYFAFSDSKSRTDTLGVGTTPTTAYTTGNTTTITGGQAIFISTPTANNTVVMFKNKPENVKGMVYSASFICNSLGKKYDVQCAIRTPAVTDAPKQSITQGWIQYSESDKAEYFYDPSSVKRTGNLVRVSDFAKYSTMQSLQGKASYNGLRTRFAINCKAKQVMVESVVFVDTTRQGSDVVLDAGGDDSPKPINKTSVLGDLSREVCGKS